MAVALISVIAFAMITASPALGDGPPTITGLSASAGSVGTVVYVNGAALAGAYSVRFGDTEAVFTVVSDGQIATSVPDGAVTAAVSVTTPDGYAQSVVFKVLPKIDAITPPSGAPGTNVTITGSAFLGAKSVIFAKGVRAVFTVVDYHTIAAVVPPLSLTGPVKVSTASGTATSPAPFVVGSDPSDPPPPPPPPPGPTQFACSRVLGFSQTIQWYVHGNFEAYVDGTKWELAAKGGGNIDEYAKPDSSIWTTKVVSRCASTTVDRIVLNVGAKIDLLPGVYANTQATIANVRAKFPDVRQIVVQPAVGGPNDTVCYYNTQPVGSTVMHEPIARDLALVVAADPIGNVVLGYDAHVTDCAMFSDASGHFYEPGYLYIGGLFGTYFANAG